jgi:hypothetical protein
MRSMTKFVAPLIALSLLMGACGGDEAEVSENPKAALETALDNLGEYEGITLTLSLGADADDLTAASEGDLNEEDAQKIVDSSLVISAKEGETADDGQFEMIANVAGTDNAVEIKAIGTTVYARADVPTLVEEFGGDTQQIDAARQQFGSQPGFEFVGPALDGEWVSAENLDQVVQQLTGQAVPTPSEEDQQLIQGFADALKANVGAEAGDRDGPGAHVVATIPLRETYDEFTKLASELGQLPTQGALPPAAEVPDENVEVDVWIEDERITQVELDFVTLARTLDEGEGIPEGVDRLALRLGVEEFTADVEAPEDATAIDVQQLMQGFLGGMRGGLEPDTQTGGGEVPEDLCSELEKQLQGQPQEVKDQIIAQFGADCPNLGK